MADVELGRAVVPIRAQLGELDKDLSAAQGKIGTALDTIGKAAGIGLGAIVGAGGAAVGVLGNLAAEAAPLEGVSRAFEGVTEDADLMLDALRKGSQGMVADAELMRTYNSAAQLVSKTFADQLPDAMGYLSKVSAATGKDMGYMIDSLVTGVGRMSPQILDNLDVQVQLSEAVERASEMFGVEADQLTKAQEQAGMMAVVTEKLAANTADMPDVAENASTKMAQFETTMQNLKAEIGTAFLPILSNVMDSFGELASEYAPQVSDAFGRIADLVGPILGEALETLIPLIMDLLDTLIPLAENIMDSVMPAFSSILEAAMELATAILDSLAPVFDELLKALLPVVTEFVDIFAPILSELISGILPFLTPLITALADVFGRLLTALMPVIGELLESLAPVLLDIADALLPPLIEVLTTLTDIFAELIEAILPPLVDLLLLVVEPVAALAELIAEGLNLALQGLADVIDKTLYPTLDWFKRSILAPIVGLFESLSEKVHAVTEKLRAFGDKIKGLADKLPDWMVPGSETPLELGLIGIARSLREVDREMRTLGATLAGETAGIAVGRASQWYGNVIVYGAQDPQTTANTVIQALRDRGMVPLAALR